MADALITIKLEGEDDGDLRLGEFIEELSGIRNALKRTQRLVLKSDAQAVDYKVVNLTHSSPATVTVAITSRDPVYADTPRRISRRFTSTLRLVRTAHRYAERIDTKTLEAFKSISSPTNKHVARITVTGERNQSVEIDRQFDRSLSRLLDGDERERDELVGRVERVDIHNKNQFDIYPAVGPERVRCSAPNGLQDQVISAIGKTVSVAGWALYRKDAPFPYACELKRFTLADPIMNSRLWKHCTA
jgi:hypothetical protein